MAQLASKPRGSLRKRFGAEALLRLDQALGNANEALPSLVPPEVPRAELRFAEPVADPEDLKRIIGKLCDKLSLDLEARGVGARRLDLVFLRVDNIAQAARIGLSRPYRAPRRRVRVSLPVEMRRARAFGDVFGAPSRRDKEHHRASRKCRRESTV
ncbi:MAG TPA: hypothetical protein VGG11_01530 [Xanthobacteraceae bacterium]